MDTARLVGILPEIETELWIRLELPGFGYNPEEKAALESDSQEKPDPDPTLEKNGSRYGSWSNQESTKTPGSGSKTLFGVFRSKES